MVVAKLTVRPELAVALRFICDKAYQTPVMTGKAMVCGALATVKLCETNGAAKYAALPVCVAWMTQVPAVSSEAVVPETEQTAGVVEARPTVRPELAVAVSGTLANA